MRTCAQYGIEGVPITIFFHKNKNKKKVVLGIKFFVIGVFLHILSIICQMILDYKVSY
jgi:hypothetical protein